MSAKYDLDRVERLSRLLGRVLVDSDSLLAMCADLRRYEKALGFYADQDNYCHHHGAVCNDCRKDLEQVLRHGFESEVAHEALAKGKA